MGCRDILLWMPVAFFALSGCSALMRSAQQPGGISFPSFSPPALSALTWAEYVFCASSARPSGNSAGETAFGFSRQPHAKPNVVNTTQPAKTRRVFISDFLSSANRDWVKFNPLLDGVSEAPFSTRRRRGNVRGTERKKEKPLCETLCSLCASASKLGLSWLKQTFPTLKPARCNDTRPSFPRRA